jgi:Flp pilus assembly protein TadG
MRRHSPSAVRRAERRAIAAVEFALVLPILLLFCMITVDCGRFGFTHIAVMNAARVGAEWGATNATSPLSSNWRTQVQAAMLAEMADVSNFNSSQFTTTITVTADSYNLNCVTATAAYKFTPLLSWPGVSGPLPVSATMCIRQFR